MGVPQFAQRGTRGADKETVATVNRPQVQYIDLTTTDTLAVDENETQEVYAPQGSIYEVLNFRFKVNEDTDAADGRHYVQVSTSNAGVVALEAISDHTESLSFYAGSFIYANDTQYPSSDSAQKMAINGLVATENEPIRISYTNEFDVPQENERNVYLIVKESGY